jgi:cytoskeletal protein CcmA (bactofilin family)
LSIITCCEYLTCFTFLKEAYTLRNVVVNVSEDVVVHRGVKRELGQVDGNLVLHDTKVRSSEPRRVIRVTGITDCSGDCSFESSLATSELRGKGGDITVDGDLNVDGNIRIMRGELEVIGDLTSNKMEVDRRAFVYGNMTVESAKVGGSLRVKGKSKATQVDVGDTFKAESDVEVDEIDVGGTVKVRGFTKSRKIDVGGTFEGDGPVEAEEIDVGGSVKINSEVSARDIDVGGSLRLSGGEVRDQINVGGSVVSDSPLDFGRIDVGGSVKLSGGKGGKVDVGGTFKSRGDLTFDEIDVGGTVNIEGNAAGDTIDVGGTVKIFGDLKLSGPFNVGGSAEVRGEVEAYNIHVGGRIEAEKIEVVGEIKTSTLRTIHGAKAKRIEISRRGEVEGPIIADYVLARDRARFEDIHAKRVILRRGSRARNVYAEIVEIEDKCRISGEVKYTETLDFERDVRFEHPPEKVESLPQPPF